MIGSCSLFLCSDICVPFVGAADGVVNVVDEAGLEEELGVLEDGSSDARDEGVVDESSGSVTDRVGSSDPFSLEASIVGEGVVESWPLFDVTVGASVFATSCRR
jgi:hypothetical protein